jgi:hypothetical protein
MGTHQVQIDDDVFEFIKANAEPLVDDFNSVLRRLLAVKRTGPNIPGPAAAATSTVRSIELPILANGTPMALRQILGVIHLVRVGGDSRIAANHVVAKWHGVADQTVLDKYTRQLGLTASQFDRLLEEESLDSLRRLLKQKFDEYADAVDKSLK